METRSSIFTSGMDGHLRLFEECNGKLLIHNSADNIFSEGIGITTMRVCAAEHVLVAASARKSWGMWSSITLKKILIVNEEEAVRMRMRMRGFLVSCIHCLINQCAPSQVTAIEAIPNFMSSKADAKTSSQPGSSSSSNLLTFAVAVRRRII